MPEYLAQVDFSMKNRYCRLYDPAAIIIPAMHRQQPREYDQHSMNSPADSTVVADVLIEDGRTNPNPALLNVCWNCREGEILRSGPRNNA